LTIGLTLLANEGTYISIGPGFNIETTTVIEAVKGIVTGLISIKKRIRSNSQKLKLKLLKWGKLSNSFPIFQMWLVLLIAHMSQSTKVPADSRVDYFCRLSKVWLMTRKDSLMLQLVFQDSCIMNACYETVAFTDDARTKNY